MIGLNFRFSNPNDPSFKRNLINSAGDTLTAVMTLRELKRKYVLCFTALTCTYRCKFLLVVFLCHFNFLPKSFFAKYILPFYEEIQLALDKRFASTQVILLWPRRTKGLKAVPIWSFFGCILTSL